MSHILVCGSTNGYNIHMALDHTTIALFYAALCFALRVTILFQCQVDAALWVIVQ